jgi:hypothetical protein
MMTRKDYIATADILNDVSADIDADVFIRLVDAFADMFELDNPNFDAVRFANATGVKYPTYN